MKGSEGEAKRERDKRERAQLQSSQCGQWVLLILMVQFIFLPNPASLTSLPALLLKALFNK